MKRTWITNGIEDEQIYIDESIPEGWKKGRTKCSKVCQYDNNKALEFYKNHTDSELRKEFNLTYGAFIDFLKKNNIQKRSQSEANKLGCQHKYGVDNPFQAEEVKGKIKSTWINKYGADNPNKSPNVRKKTK